MEPYKTERSWISTADELIQYELTSGELELVTQQKFAPEAAVIADFIQRLGLDAYIDIGCWYGLLLQEVLARVQPRTVVALDAVQAFVDLAKSRVGEDWASYFCRTVVPTCLIRSPLPEFRLHTGDSSESGIGLKGGVPVTTGRTTTLVHFLRRNVPSLERSYLKIDIEGLDSLLVADLVTLGCYPAVLHFEYLPWIDYSEAFDALRSSGYKLPDLRPGHRFYSFACSRDEAFLIGFEPTSIYTEK
jgi:SAM-dependent methyltransferase